MKERVRGGSCLRSLMCEKEHKVKLDRQMELRRYHRGQARAQHVGTREREAGVVGFYEKGTHKKEIR